MTDAELIQTISNSLPEEYSAEVLALLRARVRQSPAVRSAIVTQIQTESSLRGALDEHRVSIPAILARAASLGILAKLFLAKQWFWGILTTALITLGGAAIVVMNSHSTGSPKASPSIDIAEAPSPSDLLADPQSPAAESNPLALETQRPNQIPGTARVLSGGWLVPIDEEQPSSATEQQGELRILGTHQMRESPQRGEKLELKIQPSPGFQIHAWRRRSGVSIYYCEHPVRCWVAYLSWPRRNSYLPDRLAMAGVLPISGSNDTPHHVSLGSTDSSITIQVDNGQVLAVPLADSAERFIFQGQAAISSAKVSPLLAAGESPAGVEPKTSVPVAGDWTGTMPKGATWQLLPADRWELAGEFLAEPAMQSLLAGSPNCRSVEFRLEDPTAGTGLLLLDTNGVEIGGLEFVDSPDNSQSIFQLHNGDDAAGERVSVTGDPDPAIQPVGYVGPSQWFRLSLASDGMRLETSHNGRDWGLAGEISGRFSDASIGSVRLYCLPGTGSRCIRLSHLLLR